MVVSRQSHCYRSRRFDRELLVFIRLKTSSKRSKRSYKKLIKKERKKVKKKAKYGNYRSLRRICVKAWFR